MSSTGTTLNATIALVYPATAIRVMFGSHGSLSWMKRTPRPRSKQV
ncbi:MAG: hypothetical protein OXM02_04640 [Bacteroidota bacterium]|nr:hypothetical protein [Bacteroidota bacterium]MDE2833790.1 hypothetical protein [Bacteroidota bacterium]MDE2956146.1 hypothetical protein [Bacteroidota bacterium]